MGECRRIFNIRMLLIIAGVTALNIFLFTYQAIGGKSFSKIMFEKEQREYLIDKYSGCDAAQALRNLRELENQLCDGEQKNQQYDYEEISAYYEQFDSSEKEWFMEVQDESCDYNSEYGSIQRKRGRCRRKSDKEADRAGGTHDRVPESPSL